MWYNVGMHQRFKKLAQVCLAVAFTVTAFIGAAGTAHAAGLVVCGGGAGETTAAQQVSQSTSTSTMATSLTNFQSNSCQLSDIFKEAALVANGLIALAGAAAVVFIVIAGAKLLIFSGNESAIKDATNSLRDAIIGLVIVVCAFIIINTIFSVLYVQLGGGTSFPYNPFA
jgi:hypothetical protein